VTAGRWRAGVILVAVVLSACGGGGKSKSSSTTSRGATGSCVADDKFDDGNGHVPNFTDLTYTVQPPAGGNHWQSPAPGGVYGPEEIPPQGAVVHALEHGFVAIWYRIGISSADRKRIEDLGHELKPDVLVVPQKQLPVPLAATAWHHRLLCQSVDLEPIRRFEAKWRNQGPERIPHQ